MAEAEGFGATGDTRPIDRRIDALMEVMTESEQRLARVVLEAQGTLGSYTAAELAGLAGVSSATAARFFQRLGYPTFGAVRRQARDLHWASPLQSQGGLQAGAARTDGRDFAGHIDQDCRNLMRTTKTISAPALAEAVAVLAPARTVWVIGFRNSFALATLARALLVTVKDDVRLLPGAGMTLAEDMAGLQAGQAVLAVGFRRQPPMLREALQAAKAAGVPSVLIADDSAAATARLAQVMLRCPIGGSGPYDSYAAAVSVINYLTLQTGVAMGREATERLRSIEAMHLQLRSFEPPPRMREE